MLSDFMHLRKMNCLSATSIALIDAAPWGHQSGMEGA